MKELKHPFAKSSPNPEKGDDMKDHGRQEQMIAGKKGSPEAEINS